MAVQTELLDDLRKEFNLAPDVDLRAVYGCSWFGFMGMSVRGAMYIFNKAVIFKPNPSSMDTEERQLIPFADVDVVRKTTSSGGIHKIGITTKARKTTDFGYFEDFDRVMNKFSEVMEEYRKTHPPRNAPA